MLLAEHVGQPPGLIAGGIAQNVLLLTAETYNKYLHPLDVGNRTIFGDGAAAYADLIRENLSAPHAFAPPHLSGQRASSVAFRGMQLFRMGKAQDGSMHRPEYLRVSQAERVRAEKAEKSREVM